MSTLQDVQIYYRAGKYGAGEVSLSPQPGAEIISHDEGVEDNLGWGSLLVFDTEAEAKAFLVGVDMCGDENDICYDSLILPGGPTVVLVIDTDGEGGIEQYLNKRADPTEPLAITVSASAPAPSL